MRIRAEVVDEFCITLGGHRIRNIVTEANVIR
jgi:hypothetical protein